jgi:hypothetical protein
MDVDVDSAITRRLPITNALDLCSARRIHRRPDGLVVEDGPLVLPPPMNASERESDMRNYDWIEGSEIGPLQTDVRFAWGPRSLSVMHTWPSVAIYSGRRLFLMGRDLPVRDITERCTKLARSVGLVTVARDDLI